MENPEIINTSVPKYVGLEKGMKSSEIGKIFEINLGCFGGMDATTYKQAWDETFQQFGNKQPLVRNFFKKLDEAQPEESKDLFANSLKNVASSIVSAAKEKNLEEVYVVVTNKAYFEPGEEDFLLAREIAKQLGRDPDVFAKNNTLTVDQYIDQVETGQIDQVKSFIYDDFTPNDLIEHFSDKEKAKYAESFFVTGHSLYPRGIEDPTDKDFFRKEKLNTDNPYFPLLRKPIHKDLISKESIKDFDLSKKVLKILGGSSGVGIKFYKKEIDRQNEKETETFFNEQDILELKDTPNTEFVLEDFVPGPVTRQPINLVKQEDGSAISEYGKVKDYAVDLRFGYEYDPESGELKAITSYGRFARPGEKNNISQGGGVVEVKVVKDKDYYPLLSEMYKIVGSLSVEDGKEFHQSFSKNLEKRGFLNNGSPIPFAPLPYLVSESTFNEMKGTARYLAKQMQAKKHPDKSKFIFALDAFANPQPEIFKV